jgi:ADP-heptose:LPS heptosyltransferase
MFNKILGKLYFYNYLRHNPTQTKDIDCLIQQPKKILIISNTAFGDLLLSTPAMQSIRVSFNSAQIALLAQKQMLPLAKNFTFIDEFFPFFGGYKNFIQTSKQLYKFKPCLVLILHGNYPQDIQLAYLSGARFILKHPTNSKLKHILSYQFKKRNKTCD